MAGTAVAGPGCYIFSSLVLCPMKTPKTMLVFVNTPKNTGLSQIGSLQGMGWQERDDDDVLGLQPHVPADEAEAKIRLSHPLAEQRQRNMKDDLSKLLRSWQPEVPEPADFTRNVWRRIELAESSRRSWFRSWYETGLVLLSRPRIAVATAMVAAFAGAAVGSGTAHSDNATAYLRSVNPYAQLSDVK